MSKILELINKNCKGKVSFKSMGELGEFLGGLTGKTKDDFKDGNAHFITYVNVFNNPSLRLDLPDLVKIYPGEKQRKLEYGDVIFTASSETKEECAYCSVVTTVPQDDYYLNSFCFIWRLFNKKMYNPHFLKHYFKSQIVRKDLIKTASGVTRFNVSKKLMEKIMIPIIPLEVQDAIVKELDDYNDQNSSLLNCLKEELDLQKVRFKSIRDSVLTLVHCDYKTYKIEDICDISRGVVMSKDFIREHQGDYPVYSSQTENNGELGKINTFKYDGEFLTWTTDGANAGAVFYRSGKFSVTNVCGLLKVRNKAIDVKYLTYALNFVDKAYVSKGMGNAKLMSNVMARIVVKIPSMDEQIRIRTFLDNYNDQLNSLINAIEEEMNNRNSQFEYYRDLLMDFKE